MTASQPKNKHKLKAEKRAAALRDNLKKRRQQKKIQDTKNHESR